MAQARDEGITTIAARIVLVQETDKDKQSGILMYVPVYRQGLATDTIGQRRAALFGFIYSPIRMNDFVSGTLGKLPSDIAFEIHAGTPPNPDNLMFRSIKADTAPLPAGYEPAFTATKTVTAYGVPWRFTFKTLPVFDQELDRAKSRMVLAAGILFSLLISYLALVMQRTRNHAVTLAEAMTRQLRENDLSLRAILNSLSEQVAVIDQDGVITAVNASWHNFGASNGAQIPTPDAWHGINYLAACRPVPGEPDEGQALEAQAGIKAVLTHAVPVFVLEYPCHASAAEQRWFLMTVNQLQQAGGGAVITHLNITERRLAEERLQLREQQFRALVAASAQIVWSCTVTGEAAEDSPTWRAYTGQTVEEWHGYGYTACIHPDDREVVMARWRQALGEGSPAASEYRLRHHTGEWRWNLARGVPVRDQDGSISSWVGMNTDIHDRRLIEEEQRRVIKTSERGVLEYFFC